MTCAGCRRPRTGAACDEEESAADKASRKTSRPRAANRCRSSCSRQTIEHTLPGSELGCPCCGTEREKISQVVSEQLEHTPASLFVLEHVQITYACKKCQERGRHRSQASAADRKGSRRPGRFGRMSSPQQIRAAPARCTGREEIFARQGVLIRRSTLAGWDGRRLPSACFRRCSG